jgi:hypothetical protein
VLSLRSSRVPFPYRKPNPLHIERAGVEFTAAARVTDNVFSEGMGVEIIEMEPKDRAVLEKWVAEEESRR